MIQVLKYAVFLESMYETKKFEILIVTVMIVTIVYLEEKLSCLSSEQLQRFTLLNG